MLSTFTVNNATDTPVAGQTDLRQAIAMANAATSASTIDFNITTPATITLSNGVLELSNATYATTIDGPGANLLSISGNNASQVFQVDGGVTASISGLTITGGNAGYDSGGGLANDGGDLTLTDCTVSGNSAYSNGGGLYNTNGGDLTLTGCTVSGNSAYYGGGVWNSGVASLTNCTVSGNSASGFVGGGGLFNNYVGVATLTNCTVSGNSSGFLGGGLYNSYGGGSATLINTIVAGNVQVFDDVYGPLAAASTNNLIGGDPVLAPLANYGGPTQTMAELPGSPAIGAGTSTGAPTTDQRGRAQGRRGGHRGLPVEWVHHRLHLGQRPVGQRSVCRPAGRDRHGQQLDRAGRRGPGDLHPAGQRSVGDDLGKPGGHRLPTARRASRPRRTSSAAATPSRRRPPVRRGRPRSA